MLVPRQVAYRVVHLPQRPHRGPRAPDRSVERDGCQAAGLLAECLDVLGVPLEQRVRPDVAFAADARRERQVSLPTAKCCCQWRGARGRAVCSQRW